ncbi:MarP family serine protease [Cutibacterium equinum]|uniref:MarP family serine protease n=1 Tax=Cutibacterium equinum TaxID=3016342 RepID=A0ABY7QXF8_9ACTN|nr:MarP family serine protease [Cutibacterium equinum]WCC79748.1 MarP family serine protease [Cutibacterium equinum]
MSNVLDTILVVYLAGRAMTGWKRGAIVAVVSVAGLVLGLWAGLWISGIVAEAFFDENWTWLAEGAARACIILVVAKIIEGVCLTIARRLRNASTSARLDTVDSVGGAVLHVIASALVITVAATALAPVLPPSWAWAIDESSIVTQTNRVIPEQVNDAATRLVGQAADAFPKVFAGDTPNLLPPGPAPDDDAVTTEAVRRAATSIVKVRSRAPQCDRASEGTGWVSSPHRVVTNAHVVAGSDGVTVQVGGTGARLQASVIAYDPDVDLAVLAVPNLDAPALTMASTVNNGDAAVVAGFPLDGGYTLGAATVGPSIQARGENIYGTGTVVREILSLRATVRPGNSGGPLLTTDGKVAGTIFGRSTSQPQTGYALTNNQTRAFIRAVGPSDNHPVSTGRCTVG